MMAWLTELIERGGYAGIVLLTFIETIFPPIPSEVFMPMAGFVAARGTLSLAGVIVAGTLGSLAGATLWYGLGRAIGLHRLRDFAVRHGRWLTLHPDDIDRSTEWFARYGAAVVLFGRMVPAIRSIVSIPAGIAHMPIGRFLLFSGLGSLIWTTLLMVAGYRLGRHFGDVAHWAGPVTNIVIAGLVIVYLWRLVSYRA